MKESILVLFISKLFLVNFFSWCWLVVCWEYSLEGVEMVLMDVSRGVGIRVVLVLVIDLEFKDWL